jgi:hypothetical protein
VIRSDGVFLRLRNHSLTGERSHAGGDRGRQDRAALLASKFGVAIKVSEDGPITIYKDRKLVFA